jgi:PncC family amidohydrolase
MNLTALSQRVVTQLIQKELTLATAESCTGGLIAKLITDVAGSSKIFIGGVVSYSNEMKQKWLNVKSETLEKFGAVSEETVSEMLSGIVAATKSDLAIAVSGVAGPTGGTPEKPVGTVFIGWRFQEKQIVDRFQFDGNREEIRNFSAERALLKLIEQIN